MSFQSSNVHLDAALHSADLYAELLAQLPLTSTSPLSPPAGAPTSASAPRRVWDTTLAATSPFFAALKAETPAPDPSTNLHLTQNAGLTHISTLDPHLDLFHSLEATVDGAQLTSLLEGSWSKNPLATLKIIFHARSIPNGKGERITFYRALGWLREKSPRTFLANLEHIIKPTSLKPAKKKNAEEDDMGVVELEDDVVPDSFNARSIGYYESTFNTRLFRDLLNILILASSSALRLDADIEDALSLDSRPNRRSKSDRTARAPVRKAKRKQDEALKAMDEEEYARTKAARVEESLRRGKEEREQAREKRMEKKAEREAHVEELYGKDLSYRLLHIRVAQIFATQLLADKAALSSASTSATPVPISLGAKWTPSPHKSADRQTLITSSIAALLFPDVSLSAALASLQCAYLSPLRAHIDVVERQLSAKTYDRIRYDRVPSLAMKTLKPRFLEHDGERFKEYLKDVALGKRNIAGAALTPSSLVAEMRNLQLGWDGIGLGEVISAQWGALVQSVAEAGTLSDALAVADVSGSMGSPRFKDGTTPMDSAIGLSLLLAQIAQPPFQGTFLTFSAQPSLVTLDLSQTFQQKVQTLQSAEWGMNTDIVALFHLILNKALAAQLPPEQMIGRLFIFSDMEFEQAASYGETHFELVKLEFEERGYKLPELVFWNLGGTSSKPVTSTIPGTALVSGYSAALLKVFLEGGEYPEEESYGEMDAEGNIQERKPGIDPMAVLWKSIGHASFEGLKVAE